MERPIKSFTFKGESIPALRASMPRLIQAIDASCRNHMEIVETRAAGLVEDRDFRLIHYFTFTPWQVYQEFNGLKSEIDGRQLANEELINFYRFEGQKTEDEITAIKQKLTQDWLADPGQQQLAEMRQKLYILRQTIELRAEKVFNADEIEISTTNYTGIMDAMGYESGKYPGTIRLIDAPLRDGIMAAVTQIEDFLNGGNQEKYGIFIHTDNSDSSQPMIDIRIDDSNPDGGVTKSDGGKVGYPLTEKILSQLPGKFQNFWKYISSEEKYYLCTLRTEYSQLGTNLLDR